MDSKALMMFALLQDGRRECLQFPLASNSVAQASMHMAATHKIEIPDRHFSGSIPDFWESIPGARKVPIVT